MGIIWLSDFDEESEGVTLVRPFLQTFARKSREDEDVIGYLREVAERQQERAQAGRIIRIAARAGSYVEWKPKIPIVGIGIDLKAILRDLGHAVT